MSSVPTKRLYYQDTYCFHAPATLLSRGHDQKGTFILLDQTIFHPQGGGQPADAGTIRAGAQSISVNHVREEDGEIRHYGAFETVDIPQSVAIEVDANRRRLLARLHSGGHLIAHVVEAVWPKVTATKGYHFPDGPYVEFIDANQEDQPADLLAQVNKRLGVEIQADNPVTVSFAEDSDGAKSARRVQFGNYEVMPCGGTHVDSLTKLEGLEMIKTKISKGKLKISYRFTLEQK